MKNSDMPAMPVRGDSGEPLPREAMHSNNHLGYGPDCIGLTKREHFAGLAMQGILANQNYESPRRAKIAGMVEDSLHFADALLQELEK